MGQWISWDRLLTEDMLLYQGRHSAIYTLKHNKKMVCKVVRSTTMFLREKAFIETMKKHYTREQNIHILRYHRVVLHRSMFLMERADQDLLLWMKSHFLDPSYFHRQMAVWMMHLARGYRFLVARHMEHYDIKPDNLLIVRGVLKIADFGTCQIRQSSYLPHMGTYGYIAPEIVGITNKEYYIPHSMDVYSICLMRMYFSSASFFEAFHSNKPWDVRHYLSLEQYVSTRYTSSFYRKGLVVDQRYRLSITELLDHMENAVISPGNTAVESTTVPQTAPPPET